MARLMLCTVLAATWRETRIQPQCHSTMSGCRYSLAYRVPRPPVRISSTSTVCGSEQRVAGIGRYICFFRRLRCRCVQEASRTAASVIRLYSSYLHLPNYVTYSAGQFEEMQNMNLGGFMPLIHVLWYLDKYLLGSGYADAVVVVDDTPAMAAEIAMSDVQTKLAFLVVSAIKQKDLGNAVAGALQHAIIMRYMLEAHQTEQGATAATWDTQEEWLQRGIPL